MKITASFGTILAVGAILAMPNAASAQDSAKRSDQKTSSTGQPKPAAKAHKVWTDDDLGTLRRPSALAISSTTDVPATASPAADDSKTSAKQTDSDKPKLKDHPPLLSNPKSPADADGMIAWEQRDIDSQQEYIDGLQAELEQASPERREHLQGVIAERQQVLADTRREQQQLMAQKKQLEKKAGANGSITAATQP